MNRIVALWVTLVISLFTTSLFADSAKIGIVDLQKIMQVSTQIKDIQQKLEKEFKPRRDKLIAAEAVIKNDMEKLKRDSSILPDSQKKELERKITSARQQFERDGQQYQQELTSAQNDAMERFYTKVRTAITKIAKEDKYDMIVQKESVPYSVEALDVTDKVVKAID